jgi:uncharacterized membrane protein
MPDHIDGPSPDDMASKSEIIQPQVEFVADTATPGVAARSYDGTPPKVTTNLHFSETYQATFSTVPLPSPEALERLAQLYSDAPRIIFEEMRSQAAHRRELERSVIATKNSLAVRGQMIGGILGGVGIVGSLLVAGFGNGLAGFGIAIGSLVSLVSLFVLGRGSQQKDLESKAKVRKKMLKTENVDKIESAEKGTTEPKTTKIPDRRKKQPKETRS